MPPAPARNRYAQFNHASTMKELQKLLKPKATTFSTDVYPNLCPEISHVNYDLWTLRITLGFEKIDSPVYVEFKNVVGFRILDESNLLEFWDKNEKVPGWLWKIESGGWFELEKLREGFLAQHHGENHNEFLISGINDCISVIAESDPIITVAK